MATVNGSIIALRSPALWKLVNKFVLHPSDTGTEIYLEVSRSRVSESFLVVW